MKGKLFFEKSKRGCEKLIIIVTLSGNKLGILLHDGDGGRV